MKLLICMITYNRLPYSQRTLKELKSTIKVPHYIVVVDNASEDGTKLWLADTKQKGDIDQFIINDKNYYPGKATNIGWEEGLVNYPEATHLMRLDNDFEFKPGWDLAAQDYFKKIPELGQLGLDHEAIEDARADLRVLSINGKRLNPWPGCVGGVNIIPRKIWDSGIKYSEIMWNDGRQSPLQEDSDFSRRIKGVGYLIGHMTENLARTFTNETNWGEFPDYYKKTMSDRGYFDNLEKIK